SQSRSHCSRAWKAQLMKAIRRMRPKAATGDFLTPVATSREGHRSPTVPYTVRRPRGSNLVSIPPLDGVPTALGAPWARCSRTACRAAYEWHGKSFFYQDRANVATVRLQRPAVSPIIAETRALCPRRARALDVHKIEMTGSDKIEKTLRGPDS